MISAVPENDELIGEIESLLGESIPDNLSDKYELHKRLRTVLDKAMSYNDSFIDPIIEKARKQFERTGIPCSIEIILNPCIQNAIERSMRRCIEIYASYNKDNNFEEKKCQE